MTTVRSQADGLTLYSITDSCGVRVASIGVGLAGSSHALNRTTSCSLNSGSSLSFLTTSNAAARSAGTSPGEDRNRRKIGSPVVTMTHTSSPSCLEVARRGIRLLNSGPASDRDAPWLVG